MDSVNNKESNGPEEVEEGVENAVQEKINQMGGLIDEGAAEMLVEYEQNGNTVGQVVTSQEPGSDTVDPRRLWQNAHAVSRPEASHVEFRMTHEVLDGIPVYVCGAIQARSS